MKLLVLRCSLLLLLAAANSNSTAPKHRPISSWFPKPSATSKNPNANFAQFSESENRRWYSMAQSEIKDRVSRRYLKNKRAQNAIIFLGDGMGISTITASRILKGQLRGKNGEEENLELDLFDYSALIKTYNLDRQVPDSAGTATAYLGGVKGNYYTIGVNGRVAQDETDCRLIQESKVSSILEWAQKAGKATGIVTTARVTHASPAAAYAYTQNRDFESVVPDIVNGQPLRNRELCKDIASQLIDLEPGANFRVILGGGRSHFLPTNTFDYKGQRQLNGTLTPVRGRRTDGRNLIHDWIARQEAAGNSYRFVNNTQGLRTVNVDEVDYLMGLFNHSHMEYEFQRDKGNDGEPSLSEMTAVAIRMLQKERRGFVLFVEGARIDHAHHNGEANTAMSEMIAFDNAIRTGIDMTDGEKTSILVTADHSHSLVINGHPERGNPISGFGGVDDNGNPYTTLMYTNGPGYRDGSAQLALIRNENVFDPTFRQAATVPLIKESYHAGEDVAAYARGPFSFLMSGTHEQSYIPHALAYALCIGQFTSEPHCFGKNFIPWPLISASDKTTESTLKSNTEQKSQATDSKVTNEENIKSKIDGIVEKKVTVAVAEKKAALAESHKINAQTEQGTLNAERAKSVPVAESSKPDKSLPQNKLV